MYIYFTDESGHIIKMFAGCFVQPHVLVGGTEGTSIDFLLHDKIVSYRVREDADTVESKIGRVVRPVSQPSAIAIPQITAVR